MPSLQHGSLGIGGCNYRAYPARRQPPGLYDDMRFLYACVRDTGSSVDGKLLELQAGLGR